MRMRMNGWVRLLVVVSALWFITVGISFYRTATADEQPNDSIFFEKVFPPINPNMEAQVTKSGPLDFSDLIPTNRLSYWRLAIAAFVPPLLLAIFGSSIAWVIAGFRQNR